ncbi:hypothetical protein DIPPA_13229 [Diplonema papillatum]|nr:hypothetical protein DIPPA_13229 [Diplonema papillatum]
MKQLHSLVVGDVKESYRRSFGPLIESTAVYFLEDAFVNEAELVVLVTDKAMFACKKTTKVKRAARVKHITKLNTWQRVVRIEVAGTDADETTREGSVWDVLFRDTERARSLCFVLACLASPKDRCVIELDLTTNGFAEPVEFNFAQSTSLSARASKEVNVLRETASATDPLQSSFKDMTVEDLTSVIENLLRKTLSNPTQHAVSQPVTPAMDPFSVLSDETPDPSRIMQNRGSAKAEDPKERQWSAVSKGTFDADSSASSLDELPLKTPGPDSEPPADWKHAAPAVRKSPAAASLSRETSGSPPHYSAQRPGFGPSKAAAKTPPAGEPAARLRNDSGTSFTGTETQLQRRQSSQNGHRVSAAGDVHAAEGWAGSVADKIDAAFAGRPVPWPVAPPPSSLPLAIFSMAGQFDRVRLSAGDDLSCLVAYNSAGAVGVARLAVKETNHEVRLAIQRVSAAGDGWSSVRTFQVPPGRRFDFDGARTGAPPLFMWETVSRGSIFAVGALLQLPAEPWRACFAGRADDEDSTRAPSTSASSAVSAGHLAQLLLKATPPARVPPPLPGRVEGQGDKVLQLALRRQRSSDRESSLGDGPVHSPGSAHTAGSPQPVSSRRLRDGSASAEPLPPTHSPPPARYDGPPPAAAGERARGGSRSQATLRIQSLSASGATEYAFPADGQPQGNARSPAPARLDAAVAPGDVAPGAKLSPYASEPLSITHDLSTPASEASIVEPDFELSRQPSASPTAHDKLLGPASFQLASSSSHLHYANQPATPVTPVPVRMFNQSAFSELDRSTTLTDVGGRASSPTTPLDVCLSQSIPLSPTTLNGAPAHHSAIIGRSLFTGLDYVSPNNLPSDFQRTITKLAGGKILAMHYCGAVLQSKGSFTHTKPKILVLTQQCVYVFRPEGKVSQFAMIADVTAVVLSAKARKDWVGIRCRTGRNDLLLRMGKGAAEAHKVVYILRTLRGALRTADQPLEITFAHPEIAPGLNFAKAESAEPRQPDCPSLPVLPDTHADVVDLRERASLREQGFVELVASHAPPADVLQDFVDRHKKAGLAVRFILRLGVAEVKSCVAVGRYLDVAVLVTNSAVYVLTPEGRRRSMALDDVFEVVFADGEAVFVAKEKGLLRADGSSMLFFERGSAAWKLALAYPEQVAALEEALEAASVPMSRRELSASERQELEDDEFTADAAPRAPIPITVHVPIRPGKARRHQVSLAGSLGIFYKEVRRALVVTKTDETSPAGASGMAENSTILYADGRKIHTVDELKAAISAAAAAKKAHIAVDTLDSLPVNDQPPDFPRDAAAVPFPPVDYVDALPAGVREKMREIIKNAVSAVYHVGVAKKIGRRSDQRVVFVTDRELHLIDSDGGARGMVRLANIAEILTSHDRCIGIRAPSYYDILLQFGTDAEFDKFIRILSALYRRATSCRLVHTLVTDQPLTSLLDLNKPDWVRKAAKAQPKQKGPVII